MRIIPPAATTALTSENHVSKVFKYKDIELFVSKAVDEDAELKHFLICSIKEIPELNLLNIQYPMPFKTEEERDAVFTHFDAAHFLENLMAYVKEQKQKNEEQKSEFKRDGKPHKIGLSNDSPSLQKKSEVP